MEAISSAPLVTKRDLGPKRRILDRFIYYVVVFFLGWAASTYFYNVESIPRLKDSSYAWYTATSDKFHGICAYIYGPKKAP